MEPQAPPSRIARLSNSRTGLRDGWNMEGNMRNGRSRSPPIGLGAELGLGGSSQRSRTGCKITYGFTILQLQELQLQSLIYNSGLYQLYPSLMGSKCNPLHLEYKNRTEPEPGRCRRTDGKKWRCSKEVLPCQKYCDKHIHRGRQRSRKLVEAASHRNISTHLSISLPGISSA
ncbi:GROWTH-REGULATING FACTOR 9 [Salix koriyanagi]|uniref:Growth-regulating factor n=1 Tax=Salix koriyanagi TaxID=2511006 RepID=A0A9Q0T5P2_9ROSI|nr:GROWTH-REGULATING FACTOR 9 [Salix koriyanagi]